MLQLENIIKYHAIKTNQRVLGEYLSAAVIYFMYERTKAYEGDYYDYLDMLEETSIKIITRLLDFKGIEYKIFRDEISLKDPNTWVDLEIMGLFIAKKRRYHMVNDLEDIVKIIIQEF